MEFTLYYAAMQLVAIYICYSDDLELLLDFTSVIITPPFQYWSISTLS